jgi:hypothetical protein
MTLINEPQNSSIDNIRKQLVIPSSSQNLCQDHYSQVAVVPEPSLIRPKCGSTGPAHQLRSHNNFKRQNQATTKAYCHSIRMLRLAINFTLSVTIGTAGLSIAPSLRLQPLRDGRSSRVLETLQTFAAETYEKSPSYMEGLVTATITQVQRIFDRGEATPLDLYVHSDLGEEISILDVSDISQDFERCETGLIGAVHMLDTKSHLIYCFIKVTSVFDRLRSESWST